jgi:hypothetical protein
LIFRRFKSHGFGRRFAQSGMQFLLRFESYCVGGASPIIRVAL